MSEQTCKKRPVSVYELLLALVLGAELLLLGLVLSHAWNFATNPPERYTVDELQQAIATREATIATQVAELEASK